MVELNKIYNCDNREILKDIPDKSVQLIIVDPPYNSTPLLWDKKIDLSFYWKEFNRVIKEKGTIAIFGQEPFSSIVRLSNLKNYKYDWYWEKERLTNVFQVKRRPGKVIENISIFYNKNCKFFPQKRKHIGKLVTNKIGENARWSVTQSGYNQKTKPLEYKDDGLRYYTQLLKINRDNNRNVFHPTQKPINLIQTLIKSYTEEEDIVLDIFSGSGTSAISALNTKRNFICCELEKQYYDKSISRLEEAKIRIF